MKKKIAVVVFLVLAAAAAGYGIWSRDYKGPEEIDASLPRTREEIRAMSFSGTVVSMGKRWLVMLVDEVPAGGQQSLIGKKVKLWAGEKTFYQRGLEPGKGSFSEIKPGMRIDVLARRDLLLAVHYEPQAQRDSKKAARASAPPNEGQETGGQSRAAQQ